MVLCVGHAAAGAPGATPGTSVTVDDVAGWLRLPEGVDVDLLTSVCAATTAWVNTLPKTKALAGADWTPDIHTGATMLAARWYRRRNSPAGIDQISDMGVAYVARSDYDVAALLALHDYAPPAVA